MLFHFSPAVLRLTMRLCAWASSIMALFTQQCTMLIAHQKSPPFHDSGLPGAILTSRAVSMGLGQRPLTEVLFVPHWLTLLLVQGVFIVVLDSLEIFSDLIQSWFFDSLLWIQLGSWWWGTHNSVSNPNWFTPRIHFTGSSTMKPNSL